ncbi:MAG: GT4 family glycosyltransferase PelF [Acidobacteriaceae bacterium]|nr:GT4 family glycosyltransferase PelF [Acidobacteriaceae bacterium]
MARTSVLMCTEGTYPYYTGGVSVWCDQLVRGLPDVDFRLFAITHAPNKKPIFPIHSNIMGINSVALWGTEEPGCQGGSLSETYQRKARTTPEAVRNEFLTGFADALNCILEGGRRPQRLGNALLALHLYFQQFDYKKTMTSPEAWEVFLQLCRTASLAGSYLTIHEATTCMRWMQRFCGLLAGTLPNADITHSSMAGLACVPGVLNKLQYGSPLIVTEHGIYLRELYLSLMRSGYSEACRRFLLAFHEAVVRMNYHFADRVTALGNFNRGWQIKLGAQEAKIVITPNGTDADRFRPKPRPPNERPVVLTLARVYHLKGIEFLLRAAAIVRARVPAVLFRILGEVVDREYYEGCLNIIAEHGLKTAVEFGATKDAAEALSDADIFCLPSISEGMPYSIIEAMFCERPIVSTDVGNISEMLGGTGIVVPPADPDSLARALLTLLEGEDAAFEYRKSLARSALQRAYSLYTTEKAVGRFSDLYTSLLHGRRTAQMHTAAV